MLSGYHRHRQTLTLLGTLATRADFAAYDANHDHLGLTDVAFSGEFAEDGERRL